MHYPEDLVIRLEALWGEGFLSPGGPQEVREIVKGLHLAGKRVLDIGSGTGGPSIVLARELGAHVTGIDIEEALVTRARYLADKLALTDRLQFKLVEPGPLGFGDQVFDVVFSKDALIHVENKLAIFSEALRVLKPGGVFVASDWLAGPDIENSEVFQQYLQLTPLEFEMKTAQETENILAVAGFKDVFSQDRNHWYAAQTKEELVRFEGELRAPMIEALGEEKYQHGLAIRHALVAVTASGDLRPTHLRGVRK